MQHKPSLHSVSVDAQHKFTTAPLSTTQSNKQTRSTTVPSADSGSNLKRSSSFSGTSRPKGEIMDHRGQEDSAKSVVRARGRSSSFSNRTGKDKREVYSAEIKVSTVLWRYLKTAYSTRLEDLTSDVQMKGGHSEASRDMTVTLTGVDLSGVKSAQLGLENLVSMVATDFCVQDLRLSELGVSDPADETLEVCCTEVRSRFKKVSIEKFRDRIYLLGPEQLCSQVGAALREVFSGASVHIPEEEDFSSPSTSNINLSIPIQVNKDQNATLHHNSNPQQKLENQKDAYDGTGSGQERKSTQRGDSSETQRNSEAELVNGSVSQPLARKDPVIKEKVRRANTAQVDGQKTDTCNSTSTKENGKSVRRVNGIGSTPVHSDQHTDTPQQQRNTHSSVTQIDDRQQRGPEIHASPGGSSRSQGGLGGICVCGRSVEPLKRTECGATMCSECLHVVHAHCRVCAKTEPIPQGIQGIMSYSELPFSVPGHGKDYTVKITYCISDGIQGEGHPSPGLPFKGGVFEAFLPRCEKTRKLLPRLEKAFRLGLTFTLTGKDAGAKVTWDCIPHKTSLHGGKSGNGYPDSGYLTRLSEILSSHGIEETPAKSQE
uniref:E3 ubiquitin-protein ligase n=2 Tax=Myripristis murdjan TaxID=586833 RepID=A0A667Z8J4_9TELE